MFVKFSCNFRQYLNKILFKNRGKLIQILCVSQQHGNATGEFPTLLQERGTICIIPSTYLFLGQRQAQFR